MKKINTMKIENYGATFTDQGLQCDTCGNINDFTTIGCCDGLGGYGKVMKCNQCTARVTQMYVYENMSDGYGCAGRNIDFIV